MQPEPRGLARGRRVGRGGLGLALALLGCGGAPGIPERAHGAQVDVGTSWVSQGPGSAAFLRNLSLGARYRYQWGRFGLGGTWGVSAWRSKDLEDRDEIIAAGLLGAELSVLSADGRIRSDLNGGLARLLKGTEIDEPGGLGFYVDLRPVTYRITLDDRWRLALTPASMAMVVPDASGIPLVDVQFRGVVALEWQP